MSRDVNDPSGHTLGPPRDPTTGVVHVPVLTFRDIRSARRPAKHAAGERVTDCTVRGR